MKIFILFLVLLIASNSFAQFKGNSFYFGIGGGIAKGANASNEQTVPSARVFLQHRLVGNWLFGQFGFGYTKLQAPAYWARTASVDERLLIAPYSTEYFKPFFGAGIGLTKAVYSTGTSYLGYSPLFVGIQTKISENIVFTSYGGFALSFSDSLDGRPRDNNNLNPLTNSKQDGYYFWELGLQFGFPGKNKKSELEEFQEIPMAKVEQSPEVPDEQLTPSVEAPFTFEEVADSIIAPPPSLPEVAAQTMKDNLYRTIGFSFGGSDLTSEARYVLRVVADTLKSNPSIRIRIVGHADNQGSKEGIERFAMARAVAVKTWLVDNGISEDRLEAFSAGANEPRGDNQTFEGRAANRRVEIWVVK